MLAAAAVQGLQGRSTGRIAVLKQLTAPSIDMEVAEQLSTERGIQQAKLGRSRHPPSHYPIIPVRSALCACVRVHRCIRLRRPADGRWTMGDADLSFRLLLPFPGRQPTPLVSAAQRPSHPEATQQPPQCPVPPPDAMPRPTFAFAYTHISPPGDNKLVTNTRSVSGLLVGS